jgi:hypothetical protein
VRSLVRFAREVEDGEGVVRKLRSFDAPARLKNAFDLDIM